MRLVCVTPHWWNKYVEVCEHRRAPVGYPTKAGLFVADRDELVAGVLIYDTNGPHLFFEHLVTNQTATLRQRHEAVTMMAKEMLPYCRTMGKFPHIAVRHKGIQRILESVGMVAVAKHLTHPMTEMV